MLVFAVVLTGSMLVGALTQVRIPIFTCSTGSCAATISALPWLLAPFHFAVTRLVAGFLGPLSISAAMGAWVYSAPLERSNLLIRRFFGTVAVFAGLGALLGAGATVLFGVPVSWIVTMAGLGTVAACQAIGHESDHPKPRPSVWLPVIVGVAWTGAAIASLSPTLHVPVPMTVVDQLPTLVAGFSALAGVGAVYRAARRLGTLTRHRLMSAGQLQFTLSGAVQGVEAPLALDIATQSTFQSTGSRSSLVGRSSGFRALVWRDLLRLRAHPRVLIPVVLVLLGAAALAWTGPQATVVVTTPLLAIVLLPVLTGLRVTSRTPGLARCLPLSDFSQRAAYCVVPLVLVVAWSGFLVPTLVLFAGLSAPEALATASLIGVTALSAAVRFVTKNPTNLGLVIVTDAGPLPAGVIIAAVRGIDVLAIVLFSYLLGIPAWALLPLPIAALFLSLRQRRQ
ncbi:DUF6297 family protein [Propionimicrobium sp. PCR01-08-3]|uniref:DUF6297 family protein n=1 Tax=Propionimicrobium sp. PCR01-08-3 TaxID=3052086 RepID=UPI00255CD69C|nr:DUF6297 family protein [Propionimicrobium sp. PCR01-08-3]WIY83529.1 DUF6297 family protein [Propionimicrobium sp. PCR01-08-3]